MSVACKIGIVAAIGCLLAAGGGVLIHFFPTIVKNKVTESLNLEAEEGLPYENWEHLSLPLIMKFYFFDVQNVNDVINNGAKPKLKEKGPYTFSETRAKINITWDETEHTVSYYQTRSYQFIRDDSINDLEDLVTIPNVPAISIAEMGKNESKFKQNMLAAGMTGLFAKQAALYMTKSVRELLFDGYFDKFIQTAQKAAGKEILPNHTFAFFYELNGNHDGKYTVYTGKDDVSKYSVIKEWKGPKHMFKDVDEWGRYDKVPMWDYSTHCSDINGTDGQQFPPFVEKDKPLNIFISEMCRSAYVVYQKEVEHFGITAYRFAPDINMMADPSINPDNYCFCDGSDCMFTGLFGVGKCQRDAPIYVSFPHFHLADPMLLKAVEGLKPDPESHTIMLDVEPMTGTPINARRCSQINVKMAPTFPLYPKTEHNKMPQMYHPVLWFSEEGGLDQEFAAKFKREALLPIQVGSGLMYTAVGLGIFLILCAFGIYCKKRRDLSDDIQLEYIHPEGAKENHYVSVSPSPNRSDNQIPAEDLKKY